MDHPRSTPLGPLLRGRISPFTAWGTSRSMTSGASRTTRFGSRAKVRRPEAPRSGPSTDTSSALSADRKLPTLYKVFGLRDPATPSPPYGSSGSAPRLQREQSGPVARETHGPPPSSLNLVRWISSPSTEAKRARSSPWATPAHTASPSITRPQASGGRYSSSVTPSSLLKPETSPSAHQVWPTPSVSEPAGHASGFFATPSGTSTRASPASGKRSASPVIPRAPTTSTPAEIASGSGRMAIGSP